MWHTVQKPSPDLETNNHWHIFTFVSGLDWLRPRQNGCHFPDDIFKWIFLNENTWILIKISLKFVPKGLINKIPALVQIMAWRRSGDKPLSKAIRVNLLTHICVTRPEWVKYTSSTVIITQLIDPMIPYGVRDCGNHWFRLFFVAFSLPNYAW